MEEIREKDYNLTPASYVGISQIEENDEESFDIKMNRLMKELSEIYEKSKEIDCLLYDKLEEIGYDLKNYCRK